MSGIEDLRALGQAGFEVRVELIEGGPLLARFRAEAQSCEVVTRGRTQEWLRRLRWRGSSLGVESELRATDSRFSCYPLPRLVVCETLAAAGTAVVAARRDVPTMLMVREPEYLIRRFWNAYPLAELADRIRFVANSSVTRSVLSELAGQDIGSVLHPPVDVIESAGSRRPQRPASDGLHVVGVGRVGRLKGVDLFIECVAAVEAAGRSIRGTWIGDGDLRWARRFARSQGVESKLHFAGPQSDPYPTMGGADALLVTSRVEAFSRVAVEGFALGVPVIAFDVGGVAEAVGEAGTLVHPESVGDMAKALIGLDESSIASARVRGPAWARQFSTEEYRVRFQEVMPAW